MPENMNNGLGNKLPVTRIQKLIGKLMLQSKQQMPCCYLETSADLTSLSKIRKSYCKAVGVRVTTNDFFICAIARAVEKFPLMAAEFDATGENLHIAGQFGIGLAVAAAQGLVVPVIKDIIKKPLTQIARQSDELVRKARANKLAYDDFSGAGIVLSSLGMYGITSFFAIAPPDTIAIMSIGKVNDTIVPVNGDMMLRKKMSVALAANNRIVNEFYAAKFLNCVVTNIENPQKLTE